MKTERKEEILSLIQETGYISVEQLSQKLYISASSIRRNLTELEREGYIRRSYGGAKVIQAEHIVAPLAFRKTVNAAEKRSLCRQAIKYIKDNDIIFIDASTTTLQMAEFIDPKMGVTVITNGIPLATALVQRGIKTYCTGGEIFGNSLAHFGSYAEDFIRRFNIDTLFFSCHGVNEKGMLTDPSLPETQIRRVAIEQSEKTVFLCDETKLSLSTSYNLVPIQILDCVITNTEKVKTYFQEQDMGKVVVV